MVIATKEGFHAIKEELEKSEKCIFAEQVCNELVSYSIQSSLCYDTGANDEGDFSRNI